MNKIQYGGAVRQNPQLEQINAELFTLTYGAIVRQLIADIEDVEQVNKQLEQMGYNIGIRLIDEFLAKSKLQRCGNFRETCEVIALQAFPMFLNVRATISNWSQESAECSLILQDNPIAEYVELPEEYAKSLKYCNVLCGVIRGSLEMVNIFVECDFVKDMLKKDDCYEIRIKLVKIEGEKQPYNEDS